jgi:AcrR family transcriptional regulator
MDFQRARTDDQIEKRHSEILEACAEIYKEGGADSVTFKAISERTSFSRPTIYNYYCCKDEIILDLLTRRCEEYNSDLAARFDRVNKMTADDFCSAIAECYAAHSDMLDLMTSDLNAIENNSRMECLTAMKQTMKVSFDIVGAALEKFFPASPQAEKDRFIFTHFAFVYGAYSISNPTEKQLQAMETVCFPQSEPFDVICRSGLSALMSGF